MKQTDDIKYYTFSDVINTALQKPGGNNSKKDSVGDSEFSLNVINEMTYSNIWNSFLKWCSDQTELGYLLNIFSFGNMFYVSEKQNEGISVKLTDFFLREHNLKWNETKSNYDELYRTKYEGIQPQTEKLNYIVISTELNTKKILVQNGLNNLFYSIGYLMENTPNCLIDLGILGQFNCSNKYVYQTPSKLKSDSVNNKKTTIKSLIDRGVPKLKKEEDKEEENENTHQLTEEEEIKKKIEREISEENKKSEARNIAGMNQTDLTDQEKLEIINAKKVVREAIKNERYIGPENEEQKNQMMGDIIAVQKKLPPLKTRRSINIPMKDKKWDIIDMFHADFKIIRIQKAKANPVLFNVYSNTKAAPFTAEKTQIPIAHRIGSFYSLALQNFIIDKTSKSIKRLYDDYFFKYRNAKFEEPATELEEYLYILKYDNISSEKIEMKKDAYKRYNNFIYNSINDEYIAVMKGEWLIEIIKMINRVYLMKQYDILVNSSFKEMTQDYKIAMKTSILDYILKHPEQREKLNIPISFRKIKEYAEEQVQRPSDGDYEWKMNWNRNKLAISNNLYIMCENATKIMNYFVKNLSNTSYINLNDVYGDSWPTVKLNKFTENQRNQIQDEEKLVNENWRKFVENILKENKIYKDQLILYFKSVSGLMSAQLRKLILGSIKKYYNFIKQFKQKTYLSAKEIFDDQFNPKTIFQKSFIEVELKEHPSGTKFTFSEEISDIHDKLTNIVKEIIKCSQGVERPDNMFIKNVDKHANLWQVPFSDTEVTEMFTEIDDIVTENLEVISKVTDLYKPFEFVMKEKEEIEKFIAGNPSRKDFEKRIKFYEDNRDLLDTMPNFLYMNLIKINCTELNNTIRTKIENSIYDCLKSILSTNILLKSKNLGEGCESILSELKTQVNSVEILYKLENIAENCRSETIPQLLNDYEDFLEWVFFYLGYDTYKVLEQSKDNVNSFEQSIKTCHNNFIQIEISMKSFNDVLDNQKKKFIAELEEEKASLLSDINKLKAKVDDYRENILTRYFSDSFFSQIEQLNEMAAECKKRLKSVNDKEFYLGNAFPTEDEKVDQCINDLAPMIKYFTFSNKYEEFYKTEKNVLLCDIRFEDFDEFYNQYELFDISVQKIPKFKEKINAAKSKFESFKVSVELCKILFPLVSLFQEEDIKGDEKWKDNQIYCNEMLRYFPSSFMKSDDEDAQSAFEKLKFVDVQGYCQTLDRNRADIEKLVNEWKIIENMYELQPQITTEVQSEFVMDKYNKKEYVIIQHESFTQAINTVSKNLSLVEGKLNELEEPREEIIIVKMYKEMKAMFTETLKILKDLQDAQQNIEKLMDKLGEIKKKPDSYSYEKQAEDQYKTLMEVLNAHQRKYISVFNKKDTFISAIEEISKLTKEIYKSLSY